LGQEAWRGTQARTPAKAPSPFFSPKAIYHVHGPNEAIGNVSDAKNLITSPKTLDHIAALIDAARIESSRQEHAPRIVLKVRSSRSHVEIHIPRHCGNQSSG
jgi:hypothetical protein